MPPCLSVCMIARNEAGTIAHALASVTGIADELIVVDTGSTDRTEAMACAAGADVFRFAWCGDFATARNASLERARGDWVLVLDADEALDAGTGRQIPRLLETGADAFTVVMRNLSPPGELLQHVDMPITRLFRNRRAFRFEHPIHEQIRPAIERAGGTVHSSDVLVRHFGYAVSGEVTEARRSRNLALLEDALRVSPEDAYLHYQLGATYKSAGQADRAAFHLQRALALDNNSLLPEARSIVCQKLAQLALARSASGEALRFAKHSLMHVPNNTLSMYVAALASLDNGDLEGAHRYFAFIKDQPDVRPEHLRQVELVLTALPCQSLRSHAMRD